MPCVKKLRKRRRVSLDGELVRELRFLELDADALAKLVGAGASS